MFKISRKINAVLTSKVFSSFLCYSMLSSVFGCGRTHSIHGYNFLENLK